jgi:protein-tyrosine-phosphatase
MTPKEKADELFNKMDMIIYTDQDHDSQCKRCALIAVDEIIQQWEVIDTYVADFGGKLNQSLKFWQEVKQEIQAL